MKFDTDVGIASGVERRRSGKRELTDPFTSLLISTTTTATISILICHGCRRRRRRRIDFLFPDFHFPMQVNEALHHVSNLSEVCVEDSNGLFEAEEKVGMETMNATQGRTGRNGKIEETRSEHRSAWRHIDMTTRGTHITDGDGTVTRLRVDGSEGGTGGRKLLRGHMARRRRHTTSSSNRSSSSRYCISCLIVVADRCSSNLWSCRSRFNRRSAVMKTGGTAA